MEQSENILAENKLIPSPKSELDLQRTSFFSSSSPTEPQQPDHTPAAAASRSKSLNPFELFSLNYSQNEVGVDALRSVVIKPPICEERELPPDTEELVERAKIILRLRQAACQKRWTRESVEKEFLAQKSVNPTTSVSVTGAHKIQPTESSSSLKPPHRSPRILPKDNNFSIKKRRQSYLRASPSLEDAAGEDVLMTLQSEQQLMTIRDNEDDDEGQGDEEREQGIRIETEGDPREGEREGDDQEENQSELPQCSLSSSSAAAVSSQRDSVESVIEFWYETIPDPEMNVGSYEVKTVASALQNRMITDLINSALIRPLSKYSKKELKHTKSGAEKSRHGHGHGTTSGNDNESGGNENVCEEDDEVWEEKKSLPPISSTDLLPIFQFLSNGRSPFPKSEDLKEDLYWTEMIYELYLSKERDCWETIRVKDTSASALQTLSSRPIFKDLFSRFIHEFRYRDFLEASRQV
jgi:hypothetical protein